MVQISNKLLALIPLVLGATVSSVAAAPSARDRGNGCNRLNYGPFRLFVAPEGDQSDQSLLKLVTQSMADTGEVTSVLSLCPADDCGITPIEWVLSDGVLAAQLGEVGFTRTINLPVQPDSPLTFLTGEPGLQDPTHDYCVIRNPNTPDGLPGFLAGPEGNAEEFSICTNIPTVGEPARQDVWFKADPTTGLEKFCNKVHLIVQSTGIVPEPIPEV